MCCILNKWFKEEKFKYVQTHQNTGDKMVNITLTISGELKEELQKHREVNWSGVIRRALQEHLKKIEIAEAIAQKSKLTKKDIEEIAKKVNRDVAKKLGLR